jgi:hypothetical protein
MANKLRELLIVWEENNKWNVLAFDAALSEQHSGAVQVTSYPVDSGFMVSDHAIRLNRIFTANVLQSNFSMSVSTLRKDFKESFNELMAAVGFANIAYETTIREGRAKYDNDALTLPFFSSPVTNSVATALLGQVSMEKIDSTFEIINRLNQLGMLVHVVTLRGIKQNCVIREYSVSNTVQDSYSLPMQLTFEQLNVVTVNRPDSVPQSTNNSDGEAAITDQLTSFAAPAASVYMATARSGARALAPAVSSVKQVSIDIPSDFSEYEHIEVPYSTEYDTRFVYQNTEYTLGRLKYNKVLEAYTTRLRWIANGVTRYVESITITAGLNLVAQYNTPLPSLVAVNIDERNEDADVSTNLRLYVIVDFDEIFVG